MILMTRKLISVAIIGVFCSGIAALPAVADGNGAPAVLVKWADLNVSHIEGATKLYGRIRIAAEQVCSAFDEQGLNSLSQKKHCVDEAISNAVTKIGNPLLSTLYREKTGKDVSGRLASR